MKCCKKNTKKKFYSGEILRDRAKSPTDWFTRSKIEPLKKK